MNKYLTAIVLLLVVILGSCSGSPEVVPTNVVKSSAGLRVELEWSSGGTSTDAITNADLDLYLMKGTNEVASSERSSGFETMLLQDVYADAEYLVNVYAYRVSKNTNYTLYVKGDDEGELKSYTGVFLAGDQSLNVEFLKIKKVGTTYTITEL